MTHCKPILQEPQRAAETEKWFDDLIATLRADELRLATNTAEPKKRELYSTLISQDSEKLAEFNRQTTTRVFVASILWDYIEEIKRRNCRVKTLSVDYSDSKVLVWIEIKDNDFHTEKELILAEAKVNADYYSKGMHISSVILEEADDYPVPSHYKTLHPNPDA